MKKKQKVSEPISLVLVGTIGKYLSTKFGWTINLTIDEENDKCVRLWSQMIIANSKSAGLFKFIVKQMFFRIIIYKHTISNTNPYKYHITGSLFYDHISCGSNGREILFTVGIAGKDIDTYTLREI